MRPLSPLARSAAPLLLVAASLVVILAAAGPASSARRRAGPINAKVTVDGARAVQATITSASGGHLTVAAANGTRISVTFPAGSVASDTLVTALPVTRLSSRTLRPGLVSGIQLQPEGLRLRRPAVVRFTRRGRPRRGTRMVFVGSDGAGRDVHRVPPPFRLVGRGRQRRIVITRGPIVSISHFSTTEGFDWSAATVSEIDAISRPQQGEALLEQQVTKLLQAKATPQEILDVLDHARVHFIEPLLAVSSARLTSSCSEGTIRGGLVALQIAGNFDRQVTLLGGRSSVGHDALGSVLTQVATCMTTLCPKLGDPRAGVYFLALAHQLQLFASVGDGEFYSVLYSNLEKCGAFEVHLDSRIDNHYAMSNFSTRVEGRVTYVPKLSSEQQPRPRAPLTYTSTSGAIVGDCDTAEIASTTDGEFELSAVQFSSYDPQNPTQNPVLSLKLLVTVTPKETMHSRYTPTSPSCTPGDPLPPDLPTVNWNVGFVTEHPDYAFPGTDFVRDTAPTFALAVYNPRTTPFADGTLSENTLVEIIHKPQTPTPLPTVGG